MDKIVLENLNTDDEEKFREGLATLQQQVEGQELIPLLELFMERFELSANQLAVSAEIDISALHKILNGHNREFKTDHVNALLDDLEFLGRLKAEEKFVWRRALRIAAFQHYEFYKAIEPRLKAIEDVDERRNVLAEYLKSHYPTLAETYDKTDGKFPVVIPIYYAIAHHLLRRWGNGKELRKPKVSKKENWRQTLRRVRQGPLEPTLITIPAGDFWMGTNQRTIEKSGLEWLNWRSIETPFHRVHLSEFQIGKYPVTNAEYHRFVVAGGKEAAWWNDSKFNDPRQPVAGVTFYDALAYCQWLSEMTGQDYTLPSEAEWEKASRGTDGQIWPWGNFWEAKRCNSIESKYNQTTPVGTYSPIGDSIYQVADMSGNVAEWTRSLWVGEFVHYPYETTSERENLKSKDSRVVRGGGFGYKAEDVRCASRNGYLPESYMWFGFRVVLKTR